MAAPQDADRFLDELSDAEFVNAFIRQALHRPGYRQTAGHLRLLLSNPASDHALHLLADPRPTAQRMAVSDAARAEVLALPAVGSTDAGELLAARSGRSVRNPADALRKLARDGRLIGLRADGHRWMYPRFQFEHLDLEDPDNIVTAVNRLLDAGTFPFAAASWWISPATSLENHPRPVDLLGTDHEHLLRELAAAFAAGPDL